MTVSVDNLQKIMESLKDGNVSIDYVLGTDDPDKPFDTYSLSVDKDVQGIIAEQINKRLQKIDTSKVVEYDYTKELSRSQVGIIEIKASVARLRQMVSAIDQPNRTSFKLDKRKKDLVVAYVVSIHKKVSGKDLQLKVIKKLNLASILSKNKHRAEVGLIKGVVKGVPEDLVIMSPEAMDVIAYEDTAFIFNEINFHFLFSGSELLKEEIEKNKSIFQSSLQESEKLIEYAKKNPSILRGVYHLATANKNISINQNKALDIERRIQAVNKTTTKIFDFDPSGKIVCTDSNVKYVYWLLAKKYALSLVDDELKIFGSTYPVS